MVNRLPSWFFLAVSLILMGIAFVPLVRVALGLDETFSMQFFTVVVFMIGGLMSGLIAMILLTRRAPSIDWSELPSDQPSAARMLKIKMHASGLLLFSGIPLANFLLCYWLWVRSRTSSKEADFIGRDVLNFQISIYLYLLLSLFMVFAAIGLVTTPLVLVFHLLVTCYAIVMASLGKPYNYPLSIPIIQGRQSVADQRS